MIWAKVLRGSTKGQAGTRASHGFTPFPTVLAYFAAALFIAGCAVPDPPAAGIVGVTPAGMTPAGAYPAGLYRGVARLRGGSPLACNPTVRIDDLRVTANRVSMGAYFGTIRPDGAVILEADGEPIIGRFDSGVFSGTVRGNGDGCFYEIRATRAVGA